MNAAHVLVNTAPTGLMPTAQCGMKSVWSFKHHEYPTIPKGTQAMKAEGQKWAASSRIPPDKRQGIGSDHKWRFPPSSFPTSRFRDTYWLDAEGCLPVLLVSHKPERNTSNESES